MHIVTSAACEELCAFFRGMGTDSECRTLEEILRWDDVLLEVCHDYIQWLLPTDEPSKFNCDAPIVDAEAQRIFREDQKIRVNLRRGLGRFLRFLGLELVSGDSREEASPGSSPSSEREGALRLVKAENFERRLLMCWRGPRNHNWRRLSRALRFLRLAGLEEERQALVAVLVEIHHEYPGMIEQEAFDHWFKDGDVWSTSGAHLGESACSPKEDCDSMSCSSE